MKSYELKKDTYILVEAIYSNNKEIIGIRWFEKEQDEKKDELLNTLDKIVENNTPKTQYNNPLSTQYVTNNSHNLETYLNDTSFGVEHEVDYLGEGILGMYNPRTDTVYILRSLPPDVKEFVRAHEHAHRRRAYAGESQNENAVDREAEQKVGFNPFGYRNAA